MTDTSQEFAQFARPATFAPLTIATSGVEPLSQYTDSASAQFAVSIQ